MKKQINAFLLSFMRLLPSTNNWIIWILVALFVKSIFFILKINEPNLENALYSGSFASSGGDTASYIEPIENLLKENYYFDDYRMPGYGWIYYLLRLIFDQTHALNLLSILQLLLSAISVFALAKIALIIYKKQIAFFLTFFLYLVSTFVSLYDHELLTESFCTSSLILSVYFLLTKSSYKKNLILSGLFLTWSVFLRPVMAPLIILYCLFIFLSKCKATSTRKTFIYILIFLLPFIIIDGSWTVRNFSKYNKILPLTKSVYSPAFENSYYKPLFGFMNAIGSSLVWWEPGNEIAFFRSTPEFITKKKEVKFPSYIYTSQFNLDSLYSLKYKIETLENVNTSEKEKVNLELDIKNKFVLYTLSVKNEHPFLYYIGSRFRLLKSYFIHSGTYNLFHKSSSELNPVELLFKVFYSLMYLIIVTLGFLGIILSFFNRKLNVEYLLIAFIGSYVALVFPILLKMDESRYFVPGYPFFVLLTVFLIITIFNRLKHKKWIR